METIGGGVVSGSPADPERGEGEDREVQVQGRHDLQPGGEIVPARVCGEVPGS